MKRFCLVTALLLAFLSLPKIAKAGDLYAGSAGGPDDYTVLYTTNGVISTTTVVVSLSSQTLAGTNIWPHPLNARSIIVDTLQVEIDKLAATTAGVKIGVVREVNDSSGTVTWFDTCNSTINVSNTNNFQLVQYANGGLNTRVNNVAQVTGANTGTNPWILSNDLNQASAFYSSSSTAAGLRYPSVISQTPIYRMQVGDIVSQIITSAAANIAIQIRYHVETN